MKKRMFAFITVFVLVLSVCGSGIAAFAEASLGYEYLYDANDENRTPGYWLLTPDFAGKSITVSFEAKNYFNGIYGFYYCAKFDTPVLVTVNDENGNEAWSGTVKFYGDAWNTFMFDKVLKPGKYAVTYEMQEIDMEAFRAVFPNESDNPYWVLGSANADASRSDITIEHKGGITGTETKDAPALALVIAEEPAADTTAAPPTSDTTPAPSTSTSGGEASTPPTGDSGITGIICLALLAMVAVAGCSLIIKRKIISDRNN